MACKSDQVASMQVGQYTSLNDWSIFGGGGVTTLSHTLSQCSLGIKFIACTYEYGT